MRWWFPIVLAGCYSAQSPDLPGGPDDAGHDGASPPGDTGPADSTQMSVKYQPCFSDDFAGPTIDTQKWAFLANRGTEAQGTSHLLLTPATSDPNDEAVASRTGATLTGSTSIRATVTMNPLGFGSLEEASLVLITPDNSVLFGFGQKYDASATDHLHAFADVLGEKSDLGTGDIAYMSGVHKAFRMTVDADGLVHLETSPDGVAFSEIATSNSVLMPTGTYDVALDVHCGTSSLQVSTAAFANVVLESTDCSALPTR